jgi:hypothetical protein
MHVLLVPRRRAWSWGWSSIPPHCLANFRSILVWILVACPPDSPLTTSPRSFPFERTHSGIVGGDYYRHRRNPKRQHDDANRQNRLRGCCRYRQRTVLPNPNSVRPDAASCASGGADGVVCRCCYGRRPFYLSSFVRRGCCFFWTGTSTFYSGPKARIVFAPPFLICEAREELLEYDQRHVHRLAVSSVNNNERTPTELDSIKQSL